MSPRNARETAIEIESFDNGARHMKEHILDEVIQKVNGELLWYYMSPGPKTVVGTANFILNALERMK